MIAIQKVSVVFGTRPEAIKLCPLIVEMRKHHQFHVDVCITGQHRDMVADVLDAFGITPDVDLALMRPNQSLSEFTSRAIREIDLHFAHTEPSMTIVQGDTTTALCAAVVAFYRKTPIGHVEAGLRTWNKWSPHPEEINRVLISRIADLHFAPTDVAMQNLLKEHVHEAQIVVTGNTVIDALLAAIAQIRRRRPTIPGLPEDFQPGGGRPDVPLVLITAHRRENFGAGFRNICQAIDTLTTRFPDVQFVFPVHFNPNVREAVAHFLCQGTSHTELRSRIPNLHLLQPLGYLNFVAMMDRATLILTDSGGIQEEAPSLGKPVLLMRESTERPEAVEMGAVKLVGTNEAVIVSQVGQLLTDGTAWQHTRYGTNPYGDGNACRRIVEAIKNTTF